MSKRKQVQSSLNTFFGAKQDRESNMTPTTPAAAPITKTRSFRNRGKKGTNGYTLIKKKTKCFARFAGNFQIEKTRIIPSGLEQITFKLIA